MATFTEFYCDPVNGSNLNGGSDAGASPSMSDTAGTGSWVSATNTYTSVATTGTVAVGQFMAIFSSGATSPAWVARITAVSGGGGSAWVITLATSGAGAKPSTASTYEANVGGAWAGPTGTVGFPFTFATLTALTDASGHVMRVNFKNNGTYSITANITTSSYSATGVFQGYSSVAGDQGKAVIDGGTSGASYTLLTTNCTNQDFKDLIFQNNGATGTVSGVIQSGINNRYVRCVFAHIRGHGVASQNNVSHFLECEAYDCNQSNNSTPLGGFNTNVQGVSFRRCISHDHSAGTNAHGFIILAANLLDECVADTCAGHGVFCNTSGIPNFLNSDFYNNALSGIAIENTSCRAYIENCIFDSNGAYGVDSPPGAAPSTLMKNSAFYNNTSGQVSTNVSAGTISGSITLSSTPFNDAANGDFTLNDTSGAGAACRNAGLGEFTQTAPSYAGMISYPDAGASQSNAISPPPPGPIGQVYGARSIGTY